MFFDKINSASLNQTDKVPNDEVIKNSMKNSEDS